MKKYWIGTPFVKMALAMMAGWLIMELIGICLWGASEPKLFILIGLLMGNVLAALTLTRPVGLWKLFWVEDGKVFEENLLTRRVRSMELNVLRCARRETLRVTWLIVVDGQAPDLQQAKTLYRQGKAMFVPVEGPLAASLSEIVAKASRIE